MLLGPDFGWFGGWIMLVDVDFASSAALRATRGR